MNYFDVNFAIQIHDYIIQETGGMPGVRDKGQLESVLTHIQNDDYYSIFEDKLTHLIYSTVQFHMFNDGNKRTAIALGVYFLNLNHYTFADDEFIIKMEDTVVNIAEGKISKQGLKKLLIEILK